MKSPSLPIGFGRIFERLHQALGLSKEQVYSGLHRAAANEPIVVSLSPLLSAPGLGKARENGGIYRRNDFSVVLKAYWRGSVRSPIEAAQVFRRQAGQRSDLMSATIPK